ncbi:MAG: SMC-Scp complex subunit ScpB [bacterium]
MKSKIESLLFVSPRPLSANQLADIFKVDKTEILKACDELMEKYNAAGSGISIIKHKGWTEGGTKFQMTTSPDNGEIVSEFNKEEINSELSRPSLETLTIIAYRGPVSKAEIEQIRGINCSLILKNLLMRGLVEVKEDKDAVIDYYNITADFMRHLGISDVKGLPDYERLRGDEVIKEMLEI